MNEYSFKENLLKIPFLNLFSTQLEIGSTAVQNFKKVYFLLCIIGWN